MNENRKSNARDTALEVLLSVSAANAWSDGSLKRTIAKNKLDSREAALCTRLAYGVIQNRGLLDYYIGCWCSQKPNRLEPVILNILRIGGYQILFMDKIPHRAAVNEAVEMTKRWGRPKAAGMVNAVLSSKYKTFSNLHNANSAIFAAKLIQQLTPEYGAYVQEIAEAPPYGLAGVIARMVQPEVAIVTVVGTSHMQALVSQERIRETCLSVAEGLRENGTLILNGDDPFQKDPGCKQKVLYYAIENKDADYRAEHISGGENGMEFEVVYDGQHVPVKIACYGLHNVMDALAAFAAGKCIGMTDAEVVRGLASFRTAGIRQNVVKYGGQTMFLDCYNAAAESMQSSFNSFAMIPVKNGGRRIAVLGDLKETGKKDEEIHANVGRMLAASNVDIAVCYGDSAAIIADTAKALCGKEIIWSNDFDTVMNWLM